MIKLSPNTDQIMMFVTDEQSVFSCIPKKLWNEFIGGLPFSAKTVKIVNNTYYYLDHLASLFLLNYLNISKHKPKVKYHATSRSYDPFK